MSDSRENTGLEWIPILAFILTIGLIVLLVQAVTSPEGRRVMATIAKGLLVTLLTIGMAANYLVCSIVGLIGDALGATQTVARLALATVLTTPVVLIVLNVLVFCLAVVAEPQAALAPLLGLSLMLLLFFTPFYYWGYVATEVPWVHWRFEPLTRTDAVMRREEQVLLAQGKTTAAKLYLRLRLFFLELSAALGSEKGKRR
jgi:hypothetical protein